MGNPKGIVYATLDMNEPLTSPPLSRPRLPAIVTILTTLATTISVTFFITFWVADGWVFPLVKPTFDALGAEFPMLTQVMFDRGGYRFVGLGAVWSGIFCFGAYRHWLSLRLVVVLLVGTAVLTLAYAALAFLALCLPLLAVMDGFK